MLCIALLHLLYLCADPSSPPLPRLLLCDWPCDPVPPQSEDEDDDADGTTADLKRLVDDLPSSLRQKVLMGHKINTDGGDSDADSDDDRAAEAKLRGITNADAAAALVGNWGKKKHYWAGDTADLEIGQDMQDALDEEEAAQELQEGRLRSMDMQDYGSSSSSDSEEEEMAAPGKKNAAARLGTTVLGKMKVRAFVCISCNHAGNL